MTPRLFQRLAAIAAATYCLVFLLWPTLWAPWRLGVVVHGLLVIPALVALPGLIRGKVYTHAWSTLAATLYCAYAAWQAYDDLTVRAPALTCLCAGVLWFTASNLYVRGSRRR